MDIPVYLVAGFLDSGKTSFINGILEDGFAREDRTLLICCEEGDEEYEKKALDNVTVVTVDDEEELTLAFCKELEKKHHPKQVLIEYNGMWQMEKLYREVLPANWVLYQIMTFVHAPTFELFVKNMGQLMMEKITNADMIVFNRCDDKLIMCHSKKFPGIHCPGRFVMTCCENDIQFVGIVAKGDSLKAYKNRDWVDITATVKKEHLDAYEGEGPVLYVERITTTSKPAQEVVSF